ncbi:MAG: hypothetical protein GF308_13915 [Candidatus Heimdallarchaeota archaeon]|nr:hypothetical protein [Candidatus Heimdallarchaeota archaeon]
MIQDVTVSEEAYQQILKHVIEFANPKRPYRLWKEVIGWLIGLVDGRRVVVKRAIPMTSGSSIFVGMNDYSVIPKIAEEAAQNNAMIVGWYHSHPSFGFFLSSIDIRTQRNQQSLFEEAIAIVCDPTKITDLECGMHAYQTYMDPRQARDYRELELRVSTNINYTAILRQLLLEIGVERSYSEVISPTALKELYAMEGISLPPVSAVKSELLLPIEKRKEPVIEGNYKVTSPLMAKKEAFIELQISNVGQGIAWQIDMKFNPEPHFKLKSRYPRRIIEQLTYDTSVIETFKIIPKKSGELLLPAIDIQYLNQQQKKCWEQVPSMKINVI